jgi:hypothetical protein
VHRAKRGRKPTGRRPKQVVIRLWDEELAAIEQLRASLFPDEALASAARTLLLHYANAVSRAVADFDQLLAAADKEIEAAKAGKGRYVLSQIRGVRDYIEFTRAKRMEEARESFLSPAQLPNLAPALPAPPDQMIEQVSKLFAPNKTGGLE